MVTFGYSNLLYETHATLPSWNMACCYKEGWRVLTCCRSWFLRS